MCMCVDGDMDAGVYIDGDVYVAVEVDAGVDMSECGCECGYWC